MGYVPRNWFDMMPTASSYHCTARHKRDIHPETLKQGWSRTVLFQWNFFSLHSGCGIISLETTVWGSSKRAFRKFPRVGNAILTTIYEALNILGISYWLRRYCSCYKSPFKHLSPSQITQSLCNFLTRSASLPGTAFVKYLARYRIQTFHILV